MTLGELHAQGQRDIKKMAEHYRYPVDDIDERIWQSLDRVLHAKDITEGYELLKKAIDKFDIHCLASWSRGKIKGPASEAALEREAKQAESLSKLLREKVGDEAADKQLERASTIRSEAKKLKKTANQVESKG